MPECYPLREGGLLEKSALLGLLSFSDRFWVFPVNHLITLVYIGGYDGAKSTPS
jgi:hypothetical protein